MITVVSLDHKLLRTRAIPFSDEQQSTELLNPQAAEFRPKRRATQEAQAKIQAIAKYKEEQ
jgi:hypothetical protein